MKTGSLPTKSGISVLMPVYKPKSKWLRDCIESLNSQTHQDWQLILSLDGDDLATLSAIEIVRSALLADRKLVVIRGVRSGITGALNRGLAACNSTYTARLDADDLCKTTRLEEQWQLLEQNKDLVACGMQIEGIDEQGKRLTNRLHRYPTTPTLTRLVGALFNTPIAHPVLMFRTEVVKNVGGYRELPCMEDYDLMARLGAHGDLSNLNRIGLYYRIHTKQHSRMVRPRRGHLLAARLRFLKQLINQNPSALGLIGLPIILYAIGPQGEHWLRQVGGRYAAAIKN